MAAELSEEIVTRAMQGSELALGQVYRSLAPAVFGYFRARGASDPEAATNDVFLTVLRRLPGLRGGAAGVRSFTFSVAHARLVDDYRRQHRTPEHVRFDAASDPRSTESAESSAMARLGEAQVAAILARLPDDQAEALTLRVVAGLSVAQTASVMHRSEGAVKQLQRRALLRLRSLVDSAEVTR